MRRWRSMDEAHRIRELRRLGEIKKLEAKDERDST